MSQNPPSASDTAAPTGSKETGPLQAPPLSAQGPQESPQEKRQRFLTYLGVGVAGLSLIYLAYWGLYGSHFVSTDNAYVGSETAQVNALVSGPVKSILVSETETVKTGDVLLVIDNSDARIALEQARANLALAKRHVQGYFATDRALKGQVEARSAAIASTEAMIASAKSDYDRAKIELDRRLALMNSGAVSKDELTLAQNGFAKATAALKNAEAQKAEAQAALEAAQGTKDTNNAMISGTAEGNNPEILAAQARLDAAQLAYDRTVVRAPTNGIIAKKSVQIGQQVQIGTPLMAVVPNQNAYVDANFKEVQLKHVTPGQTVELTSDLYGKSVVFHGKVVGVSGGTGAAFSLIPAQNASGNWIKVVQRLPVRISLDPAELKAHPLRVGLSMTVKIDISKSSASKSNASKSNA